nr:expressed protein [Hymenolepis microstoma]
MLASSPSLCPASLAEAVSAFILAQVQILLATTIVGLESLAVINGQNLLTDFKMQDPKDGELPSSKQHRKTFTLTADSVDLEALTNDFQTHISNLVSTFDNFIQLLTHFYATAYVSDDFTEVGFTNNGVYFTVSLMEDNASIRLATTGRTETHPLVNSSVDELMAKIDYICKPILDL